MPLLLGNGWDLDEEPLASLVLERWLLKLDFEGIVRVTDDFDNVGSTASTDLTVNTFECVNDTTPYVPTPCLITNAVVPERSASKWRIWQWRITNEAASCVGVQSQEERNEHMVSIPESLE